MKKKFLITLILMVFISCSKNDRGELVGTKANKFFADKPNGMVMIPSGSYTMGPSNPNVLLDQNPSLKTVSIKAFYMDETEITNSEYRQFVNWVRDSVVRTELAVAAYNKIGEEIKEDDPLWDFMPIYNRVDDGDEKTAYQEYLEENFKGELDIDDKSTYRLNWDTKLIWERTDYPDANYAAVLEGGIGPDLLNDYDGYFFPADSTPNGLKAFKTKKIKYNSREFNSEKNKWNEYKAIEIYPDTTVWSRDFSFSYNEPMHNDYFWHDAYAEYPVVGVSWEQAKAFAHWRTFYKNQHQRKAKKNIQLVSDFRLPTEAEWEYAARGGLERAEYPWGGPYTYDDKGCFLANFKPERGDYIADQILYTAEAESYWPNDYGLFNMSGNVSEWTDSNFEKSSKDFVSGLNPNIEGNNNNQRKVVRGGSWKDVAHFLKVSSRDYELQNKKRSYIGFRTVQSYMGEDVGFQENPNKIF
jgi:gliding motility-associated lipoprotein GldK